MKVEVDVLGSPSLINLRFLWKHFNQLQEGNSVAKYCSSHYGFFKTVVTVSVSCVVLLSLHLSTLRFFLAD